MDVDVVEHEAAAVRVHDDAGHGVGGHVEPAPDPVGVDVLHGRDVLAWQAEVGEPGLLAVRGEVEPGRAEPGASASAATAARTSGYITTVAPP